ncbi:FAD-dependent oxidoreductase [Paenibacillus sp. LHD-117]|uniref:FAD-dependent oxidoreductase n=1 Tax=Paenibacillus sp. LHD-117 TaxID=3071412 RepID=UPI0027E1F8D1|nr:FAD-dependent oxidoreductase [Paenibacillus sp. LHD-117]MDQ6421214.1 FAD-dependent oxidoreductase [Paenibacillus sp. LHD-117]
MRQEVAQQDITVVGGGLAGVCAAIAAARLGQNVALVQNRPVLGGNSSSEVRVWVCGATGHGVNRYARESGIMGELFVENQFRNPEGNPYLWDALLLEKVKAEPNITLYLNTDVHEVDAEMASEGDIRTIRSVTGWMAGSERRIRFESKMVLDCSGDGLVGFLAGAAFRLGREAHSEFGEAWAPETADSITLGSTILFYTKDTGQPVKYVAPSFAKDIRQTSIPLKRVIRSGDSGCHYWWIEWGGEKDTVHDNEQIRDELWAVIYGIWDYIKNSGRFEAETLTLEWVGALPGKREYRRFEGDYILNQNDVVAQRPFEDRVAFGGWSIDLHPPQGMYAESRGSKHFHMDGIYHVPFRSLYSRNVSNLMMAGRNISATHIAFGTTRVMATCAVIGEAAGTGAALSTSQGKKPRELDWRELQQQLLKQDASLIGVRNEDGKDRALEADVRASDSLRRIHAEKPSAAYPLTAAVGMLIPVDPALEGFSLLLDAGRSTDLTVELWGTGRQENYIPAERIAAVNVAVREGEGQWVGIPLAWHPEQACNAFVIVRENAHIRLRLSGEPLFGLLGFEHKPQAQKEYDTDDNAQLIVEWRMGGIVRQPFCIRLHGETEAYGPAKAVDGYARPYGGPRLWSSDRMEAGREPWLELRWEEPVGVAEVQLTFNDDVNEDLINLHHHRTPFDVIPELVKDYRIEAWDVSGWRVLHREIGNRQRKRVHRLADRTTADKVRLVVESTNGCAYAQVAEIRIYNEGSGTNRV